MSSKPILRYFFELLVIFVGVILAFIAEDWREVLQEQEDYDLILDEIAQNIRQDSIEFASDIRILETHIVQINKLLDLNSELSEDSAQYMLYQLIIARWGDYKSTGYEQLKNFKTLEPNNLLIQEINSYYTFIEFLHESNKAWHSDKVQQFAAYLVSTNLKPDGYPLNKEDKKQYRQIRKDAQFQSYLRHLKINKIQQMTNWYSQLSRIRLLIDWLKPVNRQSDLTFIGLVGSGTSLGWNVDLRMKRADHNKWQLEVDLVDGEVKFRKNGQWDPNWGGLANPSFPKGKGKSGGFNIPVKEGRYRVIFNELNGDYDFQLLD